MWPFSKRKSKADMAIEAMPRAIDIAAQKWLEFEAQSFAAEMELDEKLHFFSQGIQKGFSQWNEFKDAPDSIFLLIAAKGVERSGTHLRMQIESALDIPLPGPHERTDEEENQELTNRIIEHVEQKWMYFSQNLQFKDDVPLQRQIEAFKIPLLEGLRSDYPMFREAPDQIFEPMIALGIERTGTHSLAELGRVLKLQR